MSDEYPIRPPHPEWPLTEEGWHRMWNNFYDQQDALMALLLDRATTRDVGMDQRAAFDDTVELARERNMQTKGVNLPASPLSWEHLLDMQKRIHEGNHSPAKLGRWLGWAQAALVAANVGVTLDDVKRINMLRAASAKGDGK